MIPFTNHHSRARSQWGHYHYEPIRAPPDFQLAARFVQPLLSWVGTATRQNTMGMSTWWGSMKIGILWYIDGICDLQPDLVGVSLDYNKVTTV